MGTAELEAGRLVLASAGEESRADEDCLGE
jgi:hypothetical protein